MKLGIENTLERKESRSEIEYFNDIITMNDNDDDITIYFNDKECLNLSKQDSSYMPEGSIPINLVKTNSLEYKNSNFDEIFGLTRDIDTTSKDTNWWTEANEDYANALATTMNLSKSNPLSSILVGDRIFEETHCGELNEECPGTVMNPHLKMGFFDFTEFKSSLERIKNSLKFIPVTRETMRSIDLTQETVEKSMDEEKYYIIKKQDLDSFLLKNKEVITPRIGTKGTSPKGKNTHHTQPSEKIALGKGKKKERRGKEKGKEKIVLSQKEKEKEKEKEAHLLQKVGNHKNQDNPEDGPVVLLYHKPQLRKRGRPLLRGDPPEVPMDILAACELSHISLFALAGLDNRWEKGIGRPKFRREGDRTCEYFVVGTQEDHPLGKSKNLLIFGSLSQHDKETEGDAKKENNKIKKKKEKTGTQEMRLKTSTLQMREGAITPVIEVNCTYPVKEKVNDLVWMDQKTVLAALDTDISLIHLTEEQDQVKYYFILPPFHRGSISVIDVNTQGKPLSLLSGDSAGFLYITNIDRLCEDISNCAKDGKSENLLYLAKQGSITSAKWNPNNSSIVSCTTGTGFLHLFDTRTDNEKPPLIISTRKKYLNTHAYLDENIILMGFNEGTLKAYDVRKKAKSIFTIKNPFQKSVTDIQMSDSRSVFFTLGVPGLTLWENNMPPRPPTVWAPTWPNKIQEQYSTFGSFLPNGYHDFLATDSEGTCAFFSLPC